MTFDGDERHRSEEIGSDIGPDIPYIYSQDLSTDNENTNPR